MSKRNILLLQIYLGTGYIYKNDISNLINHISKLCAKLKVSRRDIFRHIYNSTENIVVKL